MGSNERETDNEEIRETGSIELNGGGKHHIELLTIIGEIEGHEAVSNLSLIHI